MLTESVVHPWDIGKNAFVSGVSFDDMPRLGLVEIAARDGWCAALDPCMTEIYLHLSLFKSCSTTLPSVFLLAYALVAIVNHAGVILNDGAFEENR
eukprot:COSAG05_NODE_57_length_23291_cov_75.862668_27_plen_96_part_00